MKLKVEPLDNMILEHTQRITSSNKLVPVLETVTLTYKANGEVDTITVT